MRHYCSTSNEGSLSYRFQNISKSSNSAGAMFVYDVTMAAVLQLALDRPKTREARNVEIQNNNISIRIPVNG